MNGLLRILLTFFIASLTSLLAACSDNNPGAATTSGSALAVSERLSLVDYLDDDSQHLNLAEQLAKNWPFDVAVKGAEDEEAVSVNNCADAIQAYEQGQMPVASSDHPAYRQVVFLCYAAKLVTGAGAELVALEPLGIDESWLAHLPAVVAPGAAARAQGEPLLSESRDARWTDVDTVENMGEEEPGLIFVETAEQLQIISVLAKGELGRGSSDDLLVLTVASSVDEGPESMQLFWLGRGGTDSAYNVVKEF